MEGILSDSLHKTCTWHPWAMLYHTNISLSCNLVLMHNDLGVMKRDLLTCIIKMGCSVDNSSRCISKGRPLLSSMIILLSRWRDLQGLCTFHPPHNSSNRSIEGCISISAHDNPITSQHWHEKCLYFLLLAHKDISQCCSWWPFPQFHHMTLKCLTSCIRQSQSLLMRIIMAKWEDETWKWDLMKKCFLREALDLHMQVSKSPWKTMTNQSRSQT